MEKILIADDQSLFQEYFSIILGKMGYSPILANDGLDALEKAEHHEVALVFLDIEMPRMNGYETAKNLRKRGFNKPIIAVSADALSDEKEKCLKAGIDDILIKPVKMINIKNMLLKWINSAAAADDKHDAPPPPKQSTVFDGAEVLHTFMDDEQAVLSILARFIERTKAQLAAFPDLEKAEDWENARRNAHTIKGSALTISGVELGNAATRLEQAYINIDREEMKPAYIILQKAFDCFKKEAEDFIRSRN